MPLDTLRNSRLAEKEAAEDDQPRELRVAPRRARQRDRDQTDEREREQPCVLIAEASAEQAQRPGRGAERRPGPLSDRGRDLRRDVG